MSYSMKDEIEKLMGECRRRNCYHDVRNTENPGDSRGCPVCDRDDFICILVKALSGCMDQIKSFDPWGCDPSQPGGGRLAEATKALEIQRYL